MGYNYGVGWLNIHADSARRMIDLMSTKQTIAYTTADPLEINSQRHFLLNLMASIAFNLPQYRHIRHTLRTWTVYDDITATWTLYCGVPPETVRGRQPHPLRSIGEGRTIAQTKFNTGQLMSTEELVAAAPKDFALGGTAHETAYRHNKTIETTEDMAHLVGLMYEFPKHIQTVMCRFREPIENFDPIATAFDPEDWTAEMLDNHNVQFERSGEAASATDVKHTNNKP